MVTCAVLYCVEHAICDSARYLSGCNTWCGNCLVHYLVWKLQHALFNGLPSLSYCWDALTRVELDPSPADTLFVNHHIFNTHHTLNVAIAICQQIYKYVVEIFDLCITSTFLICTQDIPTVSRVPGKLGPGKLDSWAPRPNLP